MFILVPVDPNNALHVAGPPSLVLYAGQQIWVLQNLEVSVIIRLVVQITYLQVSSDFDLSRNDVKSLPNLSNKQ